MFIRMVFSNGNRLLFKIGIGVMRQGNAKLIPDSMMHIYQPIVRNRQKETNRKLMMTLDKIYFKSFLSLGEELQLM